MTTPDIVAFLRARLAEDEAAAKAAHPGPWSADATQVTAPSADGFHIPDSIADGTLYGDMHEPMNEADAAHIARHDPARVLTEVEAKRQILELHVIEVQHRDTPPFDPHTGERLPDEYEVSCSLCGWVTEDPTAACPTLHLLALPYATHLEYRPEWRP